MEIMKNGCDDEQKVMKGEELYLTRRRILRRESSDGGRPSSVYYHRRAEGVPFQWEKKPGTPKHDFINNNENIAPLSPPPWLQNMGLPRRPSCFDDDDHDDTQQSSTLLVGVFSWKKIKKTILLHVNKIGKKSGGKQEHKSSISLTSMTHHHEEEQESSSYGVGDSDGDFNNSNSSPSSSSKSSSSSCTRTTMNGGDASGFCCTPWNMNAVMSEGYKSTRYYNKANLRQEEDGYRRGGRRFFSSISSTIARLSSFDESSRFYYSIPTAHLRIPFHWEMHPGNPKTPPENDVIPPPRPPPLAQSLALPKPRIIIRSGSQSETTVVMPPPWKKIWVCMGIKQHKNKLMKSIKRLMRSSEKDSSFPLVAASSSSKTT